MTIQLRRSNTSGQPIPAGAAAGEPFVNLADNTLKISKGDGTSFLVGGGSGGGGGINLDGGNATNGSSNINLDFGNA